MKAKISEILRTFEKHENGEISYDRALEDVYKLITKFSDERKIVGYVISGTLKKVFGEILQNTKVNENIAYIYDCKIHKNELDTIKRMYDSM